MGSGRPRMPDDPRYETICGNDRMFIYHRDDMVLVPAESGERAGVKVDSPEQGSAYRDLAAALSKGSFPLRIVEISPTLDCNMRCRYCFGLNRGRFRSGGYMLRKGATHHMSKEVAESAIDYFVAHASRRGKIRCIIYGGEPLLAFDTVMHCIRYGRERAARSGRQLEWSMSTNATLLDREKIGQLLDLGVEIVASLDGPKEINDRNRVFRNGKGSHAITVKNIRLILEAQAYKPDLLRINSVCTLDTVDTFEAILYYFENEWPGIRVIFQPDFPRDPKAQAMRRIIDLFFEELVRARRDRRSPSWELVYFPAREVDRIAARDKKLFGDQSLYGITQFDVDPAGDLYPSFYLFGLERFKVGNVRDPVVDHGRINRLFAERCVDAPASRDCHECWAKYLCGGGWFYDHYIRTGSLTKRDPELCEETRCMWRRILENYLTLVTP